MTIMESKLVKEESKSKQRLKESEKVVRVAK